MTQPAVGGGAGSTISAPLPGRHASQPGRPSATRQHINLVRELAVSAFKLKYSGSVLGYLWSLLKPLLQFAILYTVFSQLLKVGAGSPHLALQILLGIVLWTLFSETTGAATLSMVNNANVLKKAYFPRIALVIASSLTALITFAINLTLVIIVAAPLGQLDLGVQTLALVPLIVELYALTLGVGLLLGCLYVFYRDVAHIWDILSQMLFYASAVVYPIAVAGRYTEVIALNPMTQIVEDARHAVVSSELPWTAAITGPLYVIPAGLAVLALVAGIVVFARTSPRIPENL